MQLEASDSKWQGSGPLFLTKPPSAFGVDGGEKSFHFSWPYCARPPSFIPTQLFWPLKVFWHLPLWGQLYVLTWDELHFKHKDSETPK